MAKKPAHSVGVLDELLGIESDGERAAEGVLKMVEPSKITVRPQARTIFDESEMADLRESIAETRKAGLGIEKSGIVQPLNARRLPSGELCLMAGERRLRAGIELRLVEVPVLVSENVADDEAELLQLIENLQRTGLYPLEEARALDRVKKRRGLSIRDLAKVVGKGKGYVEHRLALLEAPTDVQNMASARPDTIGVAREISRVTDESARKKLIESVLKGASRREIESRVAEILSPAAAPSVSPVRQTGGNSDDADFAENDRQLSSRAHESPAQKAGKGGVGSSAPVSSGVGFSTANSEGQNLKPLNLASDQEPTHSTSTAGKTELAERFAACQSQLRQLREEVTRIALTPEQWIELTNSISQIFDDALRLNNSFLDRPEAIEAQRQMREQLKKENG